MYPWYPEDGESLRFYCMEIGLPHPIAEVAGYPSEIRLHLGVKPHEQGFTVEASIEVDLNTPLYRLPAGEHKIMSRVVEETTVSGVVAAIGRCRDAFAEHYGLFDDAAVDQRSRAPGMARLSDVATTCPTAKISPSNAIGGISRLRSP